MSNQCEQILWLCVKMCFFLFFEEINCLYSTRDSGQKRFLVSKSVYLYLVFIFLSCFFYSYGIVRWCAQASKKTNWLTLEQRFCHYTNTCLSVDPLKMFKSHERYEIPECWVCMMLAVWMSKSSKKFLRLYRIVFTSCFFGDTLGAIFSI